jgi:peptidoglycan/LPS O-acetylase OafA/YrhL
VDRVANQETEAIAKTVGAQQRIPELDGLRGVAILSVIVFHYTAGEGFIPLHTFAGMLQRVVIMGWTGVDLFFVLSGFLIGGILLDVRNSSSYFSTFYLRRFFRIIPVYYLWITAYILVVLIAGSWLKAHSFSNRAPDIGFQEAAHYLFIQNLWPFALPGFEGAWFSALWSLAVEEQFYLFAPLVVRFVSPRRLAASLVAVICAAPLLRVLLLHSFHHQLSAATKLMPCRADSLALGMLMALGCRKPSVRAWLSAHTRALYGALAVLTVGMVTLWRWSPRTGDYATDSVGFTWVALFYCVILLLALFVPHGPIARVTRFGWLREVGKVSYCMYIVHSVVALACHYILLHRIPRTSTAQGLAVSILSVFVTYGCAKISWTVLEHPMLRRGHKFRYS